MGKFNLLLALAVIILRVIKRTTSEDDEVVEEELPEPPQVYEHDGTLGIIPEIFYENDTDKDLLSGARLKDFLKICKDRKNGDPDECESCPEVFSNSKNLTIFYDGRCDALAEYNFKKLRFLQRELEKKLAISIDLHLRIVFLTLYSICIAMGAYLFAVKQFRLRTLWDKFANDPTQGMRSFRYQRMKFKFDYDDPGADPEDLTGYEAWELYHSSEDEDSTRTSYTATIGPEQILAKKKRDTRRFLDTGPSEWPWERADYDFSLVPYKEGLKRDMDDWEADEGSNFNSNI